MSSDDSGGRPSLLIRNIPEKIEFSIAERNALRRFLRELSEQVAESRPFNCLLTNDKELQALNNQFLCHDCPTDVLSFPEGEPSDRLGEIAISLERAAEQARDHGHGLADEIRILTLHGVLHLLGFDHERDRGEMAQAEREWQRSFGLPSTLIGREAPPAAVRQQ
jgi:probable rRNA maturation factor